MLRGTTANTKACQLWSFQRAVKKHRQPAVSASTAINSIDDEVMSLHTSEEGIEPPKFACACRTKTFFLVDLNLIILKRYNKRVVNSKRISTKCHLVPAIEVGAPNGFLHVLQVPYRQPAHIVASGQMPILSVNSEPIKKSMQRWASMEDAPKVPHLKPLGCSVSAWKQIRFLLNDQDPLFFRARPVFHTCLCSWLSLSSESLVFKSWIFSAGKETCHRYSWQTRMHPVALGYCPRTTKRASRQATAGIFADVIWTCCLRFGEFRLKRKTWNQVENNEVKQ